MNEGWNINHTIIASSDVILGHGCLPVIEQHNNWEAMSSIPIFPQITCTYQNLLQKMCILTFPYVYKLSVRKYWMYRHVQLDDMETYISYIYLHIKYIYVSF